MGNVTLHAQDSTAVNGKVGSWVPVKANSAGQLAIGLLSGELQQFNRLAGGSIVQYVDVSADGLAVSGACIVYGVKCISGTTPTLIGYDNTSATGTVMISTGTATAETFYPLTGLNGTAATGVLLNNGFYVDVGGTNPVFRVFYVAG